MAPLRYARQGPRRLGSLQARTAGWADRATPGLGVGRVIPRAKSPLFIYPIPTVPIPSLPPPPPPPRIDRAPDSRSLDHGVVLCMISCWFSRHCFSLSSVRVSRCSRMETVCKTMGSPAQRARGPRATLGRPAASPAQPAPGPARPSSLVAAGRARAFMSTPAGSE